MFNIKSNAALILFISTVAFATSEGTNEISTVYKQFYQISNAYFRSDLNRQNLKAKTNNLNQDLETQIAKIDQIEAKYKLEVTPEYLQMALDIALISHLVDFANSKMDKAACDIAFDVNNLAESSETDNPTNRTKPVEIVLNKICNAN